MGASWYFKILVEAQNGSARVLEYGKLMMTFSHRDIHKGAPAFKVAFIEGYNIWITVVLKSGTNIPKHAMICSPFRFLDGLSHDSLVALMC